jgi:Interferon-induced transmembrane protein/GYF domain 2
MYYLSRNGTQSGPFDEAQFQQMLASGQVQPTDLYWQEGAPDWRPAVEKLRSLAPPMPSQAPGSWAQPHGQSAASPYSPPASQIRPVHSGPAPDAYLWQSIVVTILCCWPFGIPAIVYASSVSGKVSAGDMAAAKVASDKAKFWCWMSFWFGFGPLLVVIFTGGLGSLLK